MNLKQISFYIWRSQSERMGFKEQDYKPMFTRYIGVDDASEYDDILKTLYEKAKDVPFAIVFDNEIPMIAEFDIINYVGRELENMDVSNLSTQDIVLFEQDLNFNKMFLESLETVVNLAIEQENFLNKSVRNNFILKMIVWAYSYVRPIYQTFEDGKSPKCIYYGDITRHEGYFLILLYLLTFDILFINPVRDEVFPLIDKYKLSKKETGSTSVDLESLSQKTARGMLINEVQSTTLIYNEQLEAELFNNQSVFKPWQFQNGNTQSLFLNSTIYDLSNVYPEPAKVRQGFKVKGKTVYVPHLFFQIDGVFEDRDKYKKLYKLLCTTPNTYVLYGNGVELMGVLPTDEQKSEVVFCQSGNGEFDIKALKNLSYYQWDKYRDSLEDFLLNKINDTLKSNLFKKKMNHSEIVTLVADILTINEKVVRMADNFDFTSKIPKIVICLESDEQIPNRVCAVLGYLAEIGFDIVILCPSGLTSIDTWFDTRRFTQVRLEEMVYDYKFDKKVTVKDKDSSAKGFLKKLFS